MRGRPWRGRGTSRAAAPRPGRAARELRAAEAAGAQGRAARPPAGKSRGLIPAAASAGLRLCVCVRVCVCADGRSQTTAHKAPRVQRTAAAPQPRLSVARCLRLRAGLPRSLFLSLDFWVWLRLQISPNSKKQMFRPIRDGARGGGEEGSLQLQLKEIH